MRIEDVLLDLSTKGIRLSLDGDNLSVRAPKGVIDSRLREFIQHRKSEIIFFLRHRQQFSSSPAPLIRTLPRDGKLPLCYAQERFWFLAQIYPDSPVSNLPNVFRLLGPIDLTALEKSIQAIVHRHEILHTTFADIDGEPRHVVSPAIAVSLKVLDFRKISEEVRFDEAMRFAQEEAEQPFDLTQGPLIRTHILRLAEEDFLFLYTTHHIVSDGWSCKVFLHELKSFYESFTTGKPAQLPTLPVQFLDFAAQERDQTQDQAMEDHLAFWKLALSGLQFQLNLPSDHPRPPVLTYRGAHQPVRFTSSLTTSLKRLARQEDATLFMVLMAGFQTLLHKLSGQNQIAVGFPVARRNHRDVENLIGCFMDTIVACASFDDDLCFQDLLKRVRESLLAAYAHQDVPFGRLVDELQPERSLSHSPLFQAMLVFRVEDKDRGIKLAETSINRLELYTHSSKFDLTLELWEEPEGLFGSIEYNSDLFDASTIARWIEYFRELLETIVASPNNRLASLLPLIPKATRLGCPEQAERKSLPIDDVESDGTYPTPVRRRFSSGRKDLSDDERQRVLIDWNKTFAPRRDGETLHGLFQKAVNRSPNAIAISTRDKVLSFAVLDRWSDRLAGKLSVHGVGPGQIVAVCCGRSPRAVAGFLGVLKCGAAYLPLDPTYPRDRLAYMLGDSRSDLLLTEEEHLQTLPEMEIPRILLSEMEEKPIDPLRLHSTVPNDAPAYVIYTSGSTGSPKGVVGTHCGMVNRLRWMWEAFPFTADEVSAQKTSLGFIDHVSEVFGPLLQGIPLHFISDDELWDLNNFSLCLRDGGVTRLTLVPSLLRTLVKAAESGLIELPRLKFYFCSGEELPVDLARRFLELMPEARLVNLYGSSEVAADVTVHEITPRDLHGRSIPIGRPIDNVKLFVLDPEGRPVSTGTAGELFVAGRQVAEGYLHRPELTAERFPIVQLDGLPDIRCFRTGDLVRYRPTGDLEFLGRADRQVKIRGIRIELSELEAALQVLPGVEEAVALACGQRLGDKRLEAFVLGRSGIEVTGEQLRADLHKRLPAAMVPSRIQVLQNFPLTPSGKIDRMRLQANAERLELLKNDARPGNLIEQQLADLWGRILDRPSVGRFDNFFEIGGNSLLAMLTVARARYSDLIIEPRQIFEYPTIAELSKVVYQGKVTDFGGRAQEGGLIPLAHNQCRFLLRGSPEPHHWNISIRGEVCLDLEPDLLKEALSAVIATHPALSLRFAPTFEGWQQLLDTNTTIPPLQFHATENLSPDAVESFIEDRITKAQRSLDITHGPVFRLLHFDLGPDRADQIALIIHHLVCDRISCAILLDDLHFAYLQRLVGAQIKLPGTETSYPEWARVLRHYANSNAGDQQARRWLDLPWTDVQPLPKDLPGHAEDNTNAAAAALRMTLDREQTSVLLNDPDYKPQELFLAALHAAIAEWMGCETVLIELLQHGRDPFNPGMDLSRTVGMCIGYATALLSAAPAAPQTHLAEITAQLRDLPDPPWSLDIFRYMTDPARFASRCSTLPRAEVLVNYRGAAIKLGQDEFLQNIPQKPAGDHSPQGLRDHPLSFVFDVFDSRLHGTLVYCSRLHRQETAARVLRRFKEKLFALLSR